ncbi:MAG TPA: group 1 truncated hemoglobin [Gemmatimonadota bacterium]|nr:group 1 truncated hemoglobin [Gemmatimonadota bacterium]
MNRSFAYPLVFALATSFLMVVGCQPQDDAADEAGIDTLAEAADTQPTGTLYDRLGGEPAIAAVVDTFVALAAGDTELNFTRQGTANEWEATPENVELLKARLVQFVGQATGGPQVYEGQDMAAAHTGMAITNEEFDRLGGHLGAALDAYNVPEAEKQELFAIVETTRSAIVAPQ